MRMLLQIWPCRFRLLPESVGQPKRAVCRQPDLTADDSEVAVGQCVVQSIHSAPPQFVSGQKLRLWTEVENADEGARSMSSREQDYRRMSRDFDSRRCCGMQ